MVKEPKLGRFDTLFEYTTDLKYATPPYEFFLAPEFFKCPALHLVLLKRCLELHWINSITKDRNDKLALLPEKCTENRISAYIWFLLLIGAIEQAIMKALVAYRELKPDATNQNSRGEDSQQLIPPHQAPLLPIKQEQDGRFQPSQRVPRRIIAPGRPTAQLRISIRYHTKDLLNMRLSYRIAKNTREILLDITHMKLFYWLKVIVLSTGSDYLNFLEIQQWILVTCRPKRVRRRGLLP